MFLSSVNKARHNGETIAVRRRRVRADAGPRRSLNRRRDRRDFGLRDEATELARSGEARRVVFVRDDAQEAVGTLADVANPLVKIRQ